LRLTKLDVKDSAAGHVIKIIPRMSSLDAEIREIYASHINTGVASDWRRHLEAKLILIAIAGSVLLRWALSRQEIVDGQWMEVVLRVDNPSMIEVPPGIWFQMVELAEMKSGSTILSLSSLEHNDSELERFER